MKVGDAVVLSDSASALWGRAGLCGRCGLLLLVVVTRVCLADPSRRAPVAVHRAAGRKGEASIGFCIHGNTVQVELAQCVWVDELHSYHGVDVTPAGRRQALIVCVLQRCLIRVWHAEREDQVHGGKCDEDARRAGRHAHPHPGVLPEHPHLQVAPSAARLLLPFVMCSPPAWSMVFLEMKRSCRG